MEITQLLELVNHTEVVQGIADKLAEAVPVSDLMARGSNPFIPDRPDSDLPIIKMLF